jgi:hypothetical protein
VAVGLYMGFIWLVGAVTLHITPTPTWWQIAIGTNLATVAWVFLVACAIGFLKGVHDEFWSNPAPAPWTTRTGLVLSEGVLALVAIVSLYLSLSWSLYDLRSLSADDGIAKPPSEILGFSYSRYTAAIPVFIFWGAFWVACHFLWLVFVVVPRAAVGRAGLGILYAAILIAAVYGAVHLGQIQTNVVSVAKAVTNNIPLDLSVTRTMEFGHGTAKYYPLKFYWSNGKVHYYVRHRISEESFRKASEQLRLIGPNQGSSTARAIAMKYSLRNRFAEELILLEIPPEQFHRDQSNPDYIEAAGSAHLGEADYREIVEAWSPSRGWNYLWPPDVQK